MKKTVWVGAAGTNVGLAVASAIDRNWKDRVELIVGDTNDWNLVAASSFAKTFRHMPFGNSKEFIGVLVENLRMDKVASYIPTHDQEIVVIAKNLEMLRTQTYTEFAISTPEAIETCHDKLSIYELFLKHAVPTPRTWHASQTTWNGSALFGKPRFGCGSIGARHVATEKDWAAAASDGVETLLQEICLGPEVTIDVFRDERSEFAQTACRERLATKAGVCVKARLFFDAELHNLAKKVAQLVGLTGSFCIQVMKGSNGEWVVTDVNPRMGAGTSISSAGGLDFASAHLAYHWKEDYRSYLPKLKNERFVVRYYEQVSFSKTQ